MTQCFCMLLMLTAIGCAAPGPGARSGPLPAITGAWIAEDSGRITYLSLYPDERLGHFTAQIIDYAVVDGTPVPRLTESFTAGVMPNDAGTLLWTAPYLDSSVKVAPEARRYYLVRALAQGLQLRPLRITGDTPPDQCAAIVTKSLRQKPDDPALFAGPWRSYRAMDPQRDRPLLRALLPPGYSGPF